MMSLNCFEMKVKAWSPVVLFITALLDGMMCIFRREMTHTMIYLEEITVNFNQIYYMVSIFDCL
jgi:hypothetical protein